MGNHPYTLDFTAMHAIVEAAARAACSLTIENRSRSKWYRPAVDRDLLGPLRRATRIERADDGRVLPTDRCESTGNGDRQDQHWARSRGVVATGLVRSLLQRATVRERGNRRESPERFRRSRRSVPDRRAKTRRYLFKEFSNEQAFASAVGAPKAPDC